MAASLTTNGVTYGDSTQQSTAFTGMRATFYTTAGTGTFTIPAGVTALKLTVVGAGSSSAKISCCSAMPGNSGNTSSVSSGTQTISTVSATGGPAPYTAGAAGVGSGGDFNGVGGSTGGYFQSYVTGQPRSGISGQAGYPGASSGIPGSGAFSGGAGGFAVKYLTGLTPGNTLSYTVGAGGAAPTGGCAGGAGAVIFEY